MNKQATISAQNIHGVYAIPEGLEHRPAARKALAGEVYETRTIDFMCKYMGNGDVIHAGTFFGDFLPALSKAAHPDARIWAFEPNPANHAAATETIAMNGLTNVTLTHAALGMRDDQVSFRTHDKEGAALGGRSHVTDDTGEGVVNVRSVMLDYIVPLSRPVSILQLDVEGYEKFALRGAYHLINRWKPILIVELFDKPHFFQRHFQAVEYVQLGEINNNFIYAPRDTQLSL